MAGDQRVYGGSNMTLLLQNPGGLSSLLGCRSMVKFEDVHRGEKSDKLFQYGSPDREESCNEDLGEEFRRPEKKRRLAVSQVEFLEKSFEVDNKLEPERKIQLARELGLHPRQIAIWFQNRRARWKTRQLEKDYEVLKVSYNSLQADYGNLLKEKEKLNTEVLTLTEEMLLKEKGMGKSEGSEPDKPSQPQMQNDIVSHSKLSSVEQESDVLQVVVCKQEDLCSSNSYVSDSGSTLCINNVGTASQFETADSCHVFEPDQSDLSQDEDEKLMSDSFLCPIDQVPKHEDGAHQYPHPRESACNYGLAETTDDQPLWLWSY